MIYKEIGVVGPERVARNMALKGRLYIVKKLDTILQVNEE
jgi:hypothetical protein